MDPQLLIALVSGVATVILLIVKSRLDAFGGLLAGAVVTGLVAGMPITDLVDRIAEGFGSTLGEIGIVIALGVMIGKVLEETGAAAALAAMFVRIAGRGREDVALAGTGAVVSIPVFCDSAFVILHPLARSLSRAAQRPLVVMSLALAGGLAATHHLVPPTPGPLAAAGLMNADLGLMILFGAIFAIVLLPVVIVYARYMGPKLEKHLEIEHDEAKAQAHSGGASPSSGAADDSSARDDADTDLSPDTAGAPQRPGVLRGMLPLVLPLVLIISNTVGEAVLPDGALKDFTAFVGDPGIALLIGLAIAVYVLPARGTPRTRVTGWLGNAASSAGMIVFITGAGGAFGKVLRESGVGDALADAVSNWPLPLFLVPFVIATFVRLAQGSGTVAIITGATLAAPLVSSGLNPLLGALSACAGSIVFSYFNDSFFWVVTKFTGLSGFAAMRMWSGMTTVLWLATIPLLGATALVLG